MAVTLTNSQLSAGLYSAFWNRAPDATGQNFWVNKLNTGAVTPVQMANAAFAAPEGFAAYPAWIRNDKTALVTQVYNSVFNRAPDANGLAFWTAQLTADSLGNVTNFPEVVLGMMNSAIQSAAAGNTDGMQFLNEIQVGIFVSEVLRTDDPAITSVAFQGVSYDQASVAVREAQLYEMANPPVTYTLTTNIDTINVTGQGANTVSGIIGASQTYNTGDTVNGNGLTKVALVADGSNDDAANNPIVTLNNVASANLNLVSDTQVNATYYDVGSLNVTQGVATTTLTVNEAQLETTYGLSSGRQNNLTIATWNDVTTGTNDTVNLSLGGTNATTASLVDVSGAGNAIEAVNIAVSGTNNIALTAGTGATSYVVTGSGTNTVDIVSSSDALVDFSGTTGTNTINMNDHLTAADTIVGGSGTDTLRIAPGGNIGGRLQVSGVEALSLAATATSSAGFGDVTGITTVNLIAAAGLDDYVFSANQLTGVDTINITGLAANDADANDVNGLKVGGAAATDINVNVTADVIDAAGLLTLSSVTDLAINLTGNVDNNAATLGGVTATGLKSLTVGSAGFVDAEAEVNLTIGEVTASGKTIATVDLSGADTGVRVTFASTSLADSAVVTGGTGNDTIVATDVVLSATNKSVTIVGNLGADTMRAIGAGAGSTIFQIAEGDSGITLTTIDSITGFDDTATTGDYLKLGVAGDATDVTGNYAAEFADADLTFANALANANTLFATLADTTQYTQIYALQIDTTADVAWLFTDYDLDGVADQAVQIATITGVDDFSAANIIA